MDRSARLKEHRLRLIHSGQLLADNTEVFHWLKVLEEQHRPSTETSETSEGRSIIWLHCSVGPKLEPGEEDETKVQVCWARHLLNGADIHAFCVPLRKRN